MKRTMQKQSYETAARKLRDLADLLEINASREHPQQKRQLTLTINNINRYGDKLASQHHGRPSGRQMLRAERAEAFAAGVLLSLDHLAMTVGISSPVYQRIVSTAGGFDYLLEHAAKPDRKHLLRAKRLWLWAYMTRRTQHEN